MTLPLRGGFRHLYAYLAAAATPTWVLLPPPPLPLQAPRLRALDSLGVLLGSCGDGKVSMDSMTLPLRSIHAALFTDVGSAVFAVPLFRNVFAAEEALHLLLLKSSTWAVGLFPYIIAGLLRRETHPPRVATGG